jgi:hypothetical protein
VCREGIDVAERGIADAGGGVAVVEEFADVVAEPAHVVEPTSRDAAEVERLIVEPAIDGPIVLGCVPESQQP